LRCSGIFRDSIIANFRLIVTAKKSLKIRQYLMKLEGVQKCAKFLDHPVHVTRRHLTVYITRTLYADVYYNFSQRRHDLAPFGPRQGSIESLYAVAVVRYSVCRQL